MKIVFAGTPEFARRALLAVGQAGHEVALVLTQPDRPSGRGMKSKPSPVKLEAQA
ncbi:MAG: methionyl-tRNA formyltransferase, partial [Thiobacillaceae bacterium]